MNISRRGLLSFAGGAAAIAGLNACGGNSGGLTSGSSASNGAALTQWYHEYGEQGVEAAVRKYASAYPNATVEVKWNPGEYMKLLNSQLLTGDVPDIFESENGATVDMINAGQVEDLTELIKPYVDQFAPSVIERFTFKDAIWSIPQTIDCRVLYYRPSLLATAGLSAPTTLTELLTTADALTTDTRGGFFGGNDGGVTVMAPLFIWASGHKELNGERTELGFLDDSFYGVVSEYAEWYKSGKGLLKAASAEWSSAAPFINEECAMQWTGLWNLPEVLAAHGDDVAVMAMPAMGSSGTQAIHFGAYGSCAAVKGKDPAAAKEFIKWLWIDQEDYQVEFADSFGTHIPAKPALAAKATKLASGPGATAAQLVAEHGFTADIMWSGALGTAYTDAVSEVVVKGVDPKQAFQALAETAKTELAS
ncbi:hypothetical protein HMPREF1531_01580 [Propionibacterium sp. oral taxon 192 str. F0372]|uniref:ABC transporter substrate-binding protein n=1 Tax=Propionibacterium sp. oral taxon 192 TaxID=671222 RepID=UPI0003542647|nr:extracellular solute-binding protein [Propionibacterium sp. oral taxon 192]EPH02274.1 hypothetical protein HMPREF1531_01580 [Propionibacterium sp. oral taxon 192 str. F0372]